MSEILLQICFQIVTSLLALPFVIERPVHARDPRYQKSTFLLQNLGICRHLGIYHMIYVG